MGNRKCLKVLWYLALTVRRKLVGGTEEGS
jgi:hypothetical protein